MTFSELHRLLKAHGCRPRKSKVRWTADCPRCGAQLIYWVIEPHLRLAVYCRGGCPKKQIISAARGQLELLDLEEGR